MPGLASADPQTLPTLSITRMNGGLRSNGITSSIRNVEQMDPAENARMHQQTSCIHSKDSYLPVQVDAAVVDDSLSLYCKPVELYNIIQRRALRNPIFLQRCLNYKIQAAHQKRIKMTISMPRVLAASAITWSNSGKIKGKSTGLSFDLQELQIRTMLVMLTSPVATPGMGHSMYRLSQTRILRFFPNNLSAAENPGQAAVTFLLPEVRKLLLNARRDGDVILFITCVDPTIPSNGQGTQINSLVQCSGPVLWGSISIATFCDNWLNHSNNGASITGLNGERVDSTFQVDLYPSRLQHEDSADGRCVRFHPIANGSNGKSMVRLQLCISGEEVGRSVSKDRFSTGSIFTSAQVCQARGLRAGRVIFHYYYQFNERHQTEATEEYSCPFCLVRCSSFKGMSCHLNATHDLFNFEFLATPDYQIVNVTCRNDMLGPEGNVQDVDGLNDPRLKNFVYWSRSGRPRKTCNQASATAQSLDQEGLIHSLPVKGSSDLEAKSQEPNSLAQIIDTALQPNKNQRVDINNSSSSQPRLVVDGSDTPEENNLQKLVGRTIDQSPAICNALPATATTTEVSDLQLSASSIQEQPKKHERQEVQDHVLESTNVDQTLPHLKKQRSEIVTVEQAESFSLPVTSVNGVCLAIAAPNVADEAGIQSSVSPQIAAALVRGEKNRKFSVERAEARNRALLQKRQFFHSHTAQLMAFEQLISDRDSEDEVDDAITDLEDRRLLDDFVDVTQDEKELMHLWNSFVRKQRVLADGHCPWACEAFSKLHAEKFAARPALRRCLMLFLTKLWNHHLVDGSTINHCLSIVDLYDEKLQQR